MLKLSAALAFAASGLVGGASTPALAQAARGPDCSAVFKVNQDRIEAFAALRKTAEIQAVFRQAGCPAPTVSLPAARAPKPKVKIRCRFKLLPPSIICTF